MEHAAKVLGKAGVCGEIRISMVATKLQNLKYPHPVLIGPFVYRRFLDVGRLKMSKSGCISGVETKSVGEDVFSLTSSSQCDVDYLGQSTKGDLNPKLEHLEAFGIYGPIEQVARVEAEEAENLLRDLGIPAWEGRAYDYCMDNLRNMGFPVDGLAFDPDLVTFSCDKRSGHRQREWKFGEG